MIDWLLMGWETSLHQTGSLVVGHYEIVAGRGSREDAIDVVVNVFFVVVFFLMATGIERSLITVKVAHFYRWAADTFHFLALFIRFPSTAIIIGSRRKFGIAFLQHKAPSVFTRFRGWPRQPKETIKRNLLARVEQAVGCYLAAYRRSPFTFFSSIFRFLLLRQKWIITRNSPPPYHRQPVANLLFNWQRSLCGRSPTAT